MNTRDITHQFESAARHLVAGTLVKDEHFSLFEAVGALEIGDAKMDSGCLEPGESLDQEFDIERHLLPEEVIWLMDELLNREVAWLMGYPLSQTLFTSIHVDRLLWPDPKSIQDSTFTRGRSPQELSLLHGALRAYCLLLVKSCDLVLAMIVSQHYYEEEDFTTQLFNRELLHKFPGQDFSKVAAAAIDAITVADYTASLRDAIIARLEFRNDVLEMLLQHAQGHAPPTFLLSSIQAALDRCRTSHSLGSSIDGAFSTKLQRRLASTVPPRPMVTVSMEQVWSFWRDMLLDCNNIFAVKHSAHSQDLFTAYAMFAFHSPQPSTYPRALLQSFLSLNDLVASRLEPKLFLEEDLQSLTLPASQLLFINGNTYGRLHYGNSIVAESIQAFVDRFEHMFVNLFRAFCLNSCRIRRTFCHALIDWDILQSQTEELDLTIQNEIKEPATKYIQDSPPVFPFSLSSWAYHHKLTILRLTIQMGFDQMIYAPSELAGMYWYLSYICDIHLSHLERISHFVTTKDSKCQTAKWPANVREQAASQCKVALDRLYREYAWAKATRLLAGALHGIFVVLQRCGIFAGNPSVYSSDTMRHEIRMKPFLALSIPEPLSHEDYENEVRIQSISTNALLDQVTALAADAKKAWEGVTKMTWNMLPKLGDDGAPSILDDKWQVDVKNCLKVTIAASLCVLTLKKLVNDEAWLTKARLETKLPENGEKGRWHRWWILPSLPAA